jgi:flagellar M-ring protein FliF
MIATAIGIVPERGDMINVISLPFVDTDKSVAEETLEPPLLIYEYIPLIKYVLIVIGAFSLYLLLIRPIMRTVRGESEKHYKTVAQLEQEQQELSRKEKEGGLPPPPVDDAITTLRREVMHNQAPAAFIVKNWIQEG